MGSKKRRAIPRFSTPIIETHCHLDYLDTVTLGETLAQAADVGVERVITIAVSPDNLDTVRALADSHTTVWGTQGIHPTKQDLLMPGWNRRSAQGFPANA
ncbi:MAG: TatD family hydrolase [Halioglobus sp.]|nr:TatD family hydrolase [Halioglobus sp.]